MEKFLKNSQKRQETNSQDVYISNISNPFVQNATEKNKVTKNVSNNFATQNVRSTLTKIIEFFYPNLYRIRIIKEGINKLNEIERTATELVNNNSSCGSVLNKYKLLSNCLNQANAIHSDVKKQI